MYVYMCFYSWGPARSRQQSVAFRILPVTATVWCICTLVYCIIIICLRSMWTRVQLAYICEYMRVYISNIMYTYPMYMYICVYTQASRPLPCVWTVTMTTPRSLPYGCLLTPRSTSCPTLRSLTTPGMCSMCMCMIVCSILGVHVY